MNAVDKNGVYESGNNVQVTQFNGVNARKITVSVNKDALMKVDNELSQTLSKDADYKKTPVRFMDQLFGKSDRLSADIYLAPDKPVIIGAVLQVDLDRPVTETEFDTTIDKIRTSLFIDYNRDLVIKAPESSITEQQFDALMPD